jgi:hydroxymethylpyrimidine pyrophosphatase-like HAD family hydrolase
MGNANMQVKRYADYVTTSNDDKGVMLFLEHLLSEKELLIY